jgi:hypothetical protein
MARYRTRTEKRSDFKKVRAIITIIVIALVASAGGFWFLKERNSRFAVDDHLCPAQPASVTAVLVDVTDPMSLPQRQDLRNKLEELKDEIPRYGKIAIFKVDASSDELLSPVLTLCNPGDGSSVTELSGDPTGMQRRWDEAYEKPLDGAFQQLMTASGSETSPILQSIQSVTLTELKDPTVRARPRKLIVISDLLQNTKGLSFYGRVPTADEVARSAEFATSRTDLHGVEVELWMLQRPDFSSTQPRALADLWNELIGMQGGDVSSVYRVSG